MRLIHSIPGFSLRKIVTSYEILDPKAESGSKIIASDELAEGDMVVSAALNSACLKKIFEAYGEKAIMLQTGEDGKAEAVPLAVEKLVTADIIALLAQEPVQRYAAHPRQ